jgi:hypothetical protein
LRGFQIARENQIGTGTVSEIIKTIREITLMLERQVLSIDDFTNSNISWMNRFEGGESRGLCKIFRNLLF